MTNGELVKFKIEAFQEEDYSGSPVDTFELMFNPNNYSRKYEVEYHERQGAGDTGSPQIYGKIKPQEYNFEFLFDGTGTVAEKVDVHQKIQHFLEVAGKNDGDIHRPRYLKLNWGSLLVKCVLKSAEVSYTLFNPDGSPLRAKLRAAFSENIEDTLRVAEEGNNSPDLTHQRQVKEGDTLPLMVHRIYRDPAYYLEVAAANGLRNFRRLERGQGLIFPPLKTNNE